LKILGIETATEVLGVALTEDNELIAEIRSNIKRAHAEKIILTIDKVLNEIKIEPKDLDLIAVSIGPGSFTGLRIGLAAVKGLAFAANLSVVSVPTLDALALQAQLCPSQICPLIKAQANEVYTALYSFKNGNLKRKSDYQLINLESLSELIKEKTLIINSGIKNFNDFITEELKEIIEIAPHEMSLASGFSVAQIGFEKFLKNDVENIDWLTPYYLKDFKAKKKVGL